MALDRPALARLWDHVAERLQRNGLEPSGRLTLAGLDRDERHALAGLLGRPIANERVTVDLAVLDGRLRAGSGEGLVATVQRERGPLLDRPGARQARRDARARLWAVGYEALDRVGLAGAGWVELWFDDLRRAGTLARLPSPLAEAKLATAVACVRQLPMLGGSGALGAVAKVDLAALVTGSAHGLDDGSVLAATVLRAVAVITGRPYPSSPAGRRALWRAAGVASDEVSTTALTMGMRTATGDVGLDDRSAAGWETHLTARDLRRIDLVPPADGVVFVCENPRVLAAALDAGSRRAVVCTQGQPVVVVTALLERLATAGADLRYHGDFDWPGITIANPLVADLGCRPWRFGATDYLASLGRLAPMVAELPALDGEPVTAGWDGQLTVEMARAGRAVHEELVLADLLADL